MAGSLLYELSIPTFHSVLKNQILILKKGQAWCKETGTDPSDLANAKMPGDHVGLPFHVTFGASNASSYLQDLEAGPPGMKVPEILAGQESTLENLIQILEESLGHVEQANPEAFAGKEDKVIQFEHGPLNQHPTALEHLQGNILPSFWFHYTMVYSILKGKGVALNKMTYIWGLDGPVKRP